VNSLGDGMFMINSVGQEMKQRKSLALAPSEKNRDKCPR